MPFPQQKLRSCSILEELSTKEGTIADMPSPGDWGWTDSDNWKPLWNPENYFAVAAREDAQDDVNGKRQH